MAKINMNLKNDYHPIVQNDDGIYSEEYWAEMRYQRDRERRELI